MARCPPPSPKGVPALSPPSHAASGRRKAATLAPLLRGLAAPAPPQGQSRLGGRRGRRRADSWGVFPAVAAPPQPRSSLPLRAAPAFCFTRGTANAAAAMLTTEPGGGARRRRAQCGCASPADGAPGGPAPAAPGPSREREPPAGPRGPSAPSAPPPALRGCRPFPEPRLRLLLEASAAATHEPPQGNVFAEVPGAPLTILSPHGNTPPPSPAPRHPATPLRGTRRVSLRTQAREFKAGQVPFETLPLGARRQPWWAGGSPVPTAWSPDRSSQQKYLFTSGEDAGGSFPVCSPVRWREHPSPPFVPRREDAQVNAAELRSSLQPPAPGGAAPLPAGRPAGRAPTSAVGGGGLGEGESPEPEPHPGTVPSEARLGATGVPARALVRFHLLTCAAF